MSRSRAFTRHMAITKAKRKRKIAEEVYCYGKEFPYYDNLHQYSKNKIHCSCLLCSQKTKNKGQKRHNRYSPSINYKISDKRKIMKLQDSFDS